jgi:hypothetical protein
MKSLYQIIAIEVTGIALLFSSLLQAQTTYPYSSGQAVFVQSPYNSSLYTNYDYNSRQGSVNRLPAYTTNQAVFVQKPYMSQQTVTSFPSTNYNNLPLSDNRYTSPNAFPSTVAPAYSYGTTSSQQTGRYTTTIQTPTSTYTSTTSYPYTSTTPTVVYPSTSVQQTPINTSSSAQLPTGRGYSQSSLNPSSTTLNQPTNTSSVIYNNAYPVTTVSQYPYPTSTTAAPETIIQPAPKKK